MTEDVEITRYEVIEKIALGAESVLYKARDLDQNLEFCVKRIRNWFGKLFEPSERRVHKEKLTVSYSARIKHIRNEYDVAQKLKQTGVIPIVRVFGLRRIKPCFVELGYDMLMEFIEGEDLGDKRTMRMVRFPDKVNYFYQTALALQYMHQTGIVHLDMKPSNIMVTEGIVKLIDFGMSMPIGDRPKSLAGTVGYMSPEQLVREEVDASTDVFALGVTFGVILGGRPLRQSHDDINEKGTKREAKYHLATGEEPLITDVPEARHVSELETLIRRCTIPRRDKRLRDTKAVVASLQRVAQELDIKLTEPQYPL